MKLSIEKIGSESFASLVVAPFLALLLSLAFVETAVYNSIFFKGDFEHIPTFFRHLRLELSQPIVFRSWIFLALLIWGTFVSSERMGRGMIKSLDAMYGLRMSTRMTATQRLRVIWMTIAGILILTFLATYFVPGVRTWGDVGRSYLHNLFPFFLVCVVALVMYALARRPEESSVARFAREILAALLIAVVSALIYSFFLGRYFLPFRRDSLIYSTVRAGFFYKDVPILSLLVISLVLYFKSTRIWVCLSEKKPLRGTEVRRFFWLTVYYFPVAILAITLAIFAETRWATHPKFTSFLILVLGLEPSSEAYANSIDFFENHWYFRDLCCVVSAIVVLVGYSFWTSLFNMGRASSSVEETTQT